MLTMYLLPEVNLQLRPRILAELRPGTRVVSHDWDMGEWQPDARAVVEGLAKPVMPVIRTFKVIFSKQGKQVDKETSRQGAWRGHFPHPQGLLGPHLP